MNIQIKYNDEEDFINIVAAEMLFQIEKVLDAIEEKKNAASSEDREALAELWKAVKALAVARRCQFGFVSLAPPELWLNQAASLVGATVGQLEAIWEMLSE